MGFYEQTVTTAAGEELSMKDFEGKVVMVVNTATGCGFTPHYKVIEEMYEKYHEKGFEVVDVPCNQFAGQTPGTDEEIHEFCTLKYNTRVPQMKKADVNGETAIPLFKYLKEQKGFEGFDADNKLTPILEKMFDEKNPNWRETSDIKWNFTKFLINRDGDVLARFEPTHPLEKVEEAVVELLN